MVDPKKYYLQVSTGTVYDPKSHKPVHVNTSTPVDLHSDHLDAQIAVRIQNYRGLPKDSPTSSPYFSHAPHTYDLYSISFSFKPKTDIPGHELVFGNDFDESISKNLPPGFSTALRIVKWGIDPGLDGDIYSDKPYLYGPLASSINTLWVGDKNASAPLSRPDHDKPWEEGGSESGAKLREEHKVPAEGAQRMKHFLTEAHRKDWTYEAGREYRCDFFNPYLDFNELALKLPGGFNLHLMAFWDGQPLRYTLKRKTSDGKVDEVLLVVLIKLIPEEELEKKDEDGASKNKSGASVNAKSTGRDPNGPPSGATGSDSMEPPGTDDGGVD